MKSYLDKGGFLIEIDEGELAILPSGFIMMMAVPKGKHAVHFRWALAGDQSDVLRVRAVLANLLTSFPEFRSEAVGYQAFYDFLAAD